MGFLFYAMVVDVCVGWVLVYMLYKKCFCFSNVSIIFVV